MRFRVVFEAALGLGAILAVVGGGAIAALTVIDPDLALLPRLEAAYRHVIFGFLFLTLFAVSAALLGALGRTGRLEPEPAEAPAPSAPALPTPPEEAAAPAPRGDVGARFQEMKTYIDLEMWELALQKATQILQEHPETREAELVGKNINELRWKAEPKFVAGDQSLSADQEKALKEKGLAQMYQHVKTYMDLEMWELARQKALAIIKSFPDAPESAQLMKIYESIDRKARQTAGAGGPEA